MKCATCQGESDEERCTNCWEVEHRLEKYAKSEAGRDRLMNELAKYNGTIASMLKPIFTTTSGGVPHSLERTSPKGQDFIGKCVLCGKENLTLANMRVETCPNPEGKTPVAILLDAIVGPIN